MEQNTLRPFDLLLRAKAKEITVELKNGNVYLGKLKAFDIHLNLVLFETKEISCDPIKDVQDVIIRGDAVVIIKGI